MMIYIYTQNDLGQQSWKPTLLAMPRLCLLSVSAAGVEKPVMSGISLKDVLPNKFLPSSVVTFSFWGCDFDTTQMGRLGKRGVAYFWLYYSTWAWCLTSFIAKSPTFGWALCLRKLSRVVEIYGVA